MKYSKDYSLVIQVKYDNKLYGLDRQFTYLLKRFILVDVDKAFNYLLQPTYLITQYSLYDDMENDYHPLYDKYPNLLVSDIELLEKYYPQWNFQIINIRLKEFNHA